MSARRLRLAPSCSLILLPILLATACGPDADAGGEEALRPGSESSEAMDAEDAGAPQDRPLLSETIREVLEEDGPDAATRRFEEIYPDGLDAYEVDLERMGEMGGEYMAAGDFEEGGAVMSMVAELAQANLLDALPEGMAEAVRAQREGRAEDEAAEADASGGSEGAVRSREALPEDVVRRFSGVYADPDEADPDRRFFLAPDPCGGAMMFGAMWGDAANTYLEVESERVLQQPAEWTNPGEGSEPLRIEATLGPDGRAESLTHNSRWFESPLLRTGDLPEEWKDAICTRG
ncbi:MAG: hypothetical protein PVI57_03730 [Gemmatimonadota bacterium]|jgi:hypothetical protein